MNRTILGRGLLAVSLIALAACADDDDDVASPSASVPTTAPSATASASSAFPLTFENCGEEVTLESSPKRILLLDPSAAGYLEAVDALDRVAQRSGDFPEDYFSDEGNDKIGDIPELSTGQTSVGGVTLSLENVIDAEPDLVIGYATDTIDREKLAGVDIPLYVVPSYCDNPDAPSWDGMLDELEFYGRMTENTAAAEDKAEEFRDVIADVEAERPGDGLSAAALFVSSDGSAIYTYSDLSTVHDQIESLGMTNVFADLPERSPEISVEELIDADPDVLILLYTDTSKSAEDIAELVTERSGADAISAIAEDRVFTLLLNFSEPSSPITVQGLQELADRLADAGGTGSDASAGPSSASGSSSTG